jgi:tRNA nucleotidyltransferase (CCA-adding enzyme)
LAKSSQARKTWLKKNGLDIFLPFLSSKDKKLVKLTLQAFVSFLTDGKIKLTTKNQKKIFVSKSKI